MQLKQFFAKEAGLEYEIWVFDDKKDLKLKLT